MKKPTTKKQAIICEMSKGWLTTYQSLMICGTYKLSARVTELEKNFTIERKWNVTKSKYGFTTRFMSYRIVKDRFYKSGLIASGL